MIKILLDLPQVLYSASPLIVCVAVLALLGVLLSESIKKHAAVYYIVLGLPLALVAIPFAGRMIGVELFSFSRIPYLGGILRDYIHAGAFGFPLLIIIMYMGALDPRIKWVKKLMSIRKELSIISGFPIFAHSLIRVSNNFPRSLKYFIHHEEYMETAGVANETGLWISNFSFVLGIVLLIIFTPLWVTSFVSVRRRMESLKWKKLQRWAYVLYALLFIHAMGIQVGGLLNPRGGGRAQIENTQAPGNGIAAENIRSQTGAENERTPASLERRGGGGRSAESDHATQTESANHPTGRGRARENMEPDASERNNTLNVQSPAGGRGNQREVSTGPGRGGHGQGAGVADIKIGQRAKQYIHIISLILIFGSYLCLRLRKAGTDRAKRQSRTAEITSS
jgi:DMSO/TMAO reductase YedYZ heme-binding membrane subunit